MREKSKGILEMVGVVGGKRDEIYSMLRPLMLELCRLLKIRNRELRLLLPVLEDSFSDSNSGSNSL